METIFICNQCSGVLTVTPDVTRTSTLEVSLCRECIDLETDAAYDEGYDTGYNIGYNEGAKTVS